MILTSRDIGQIEEAMMVADNHRLQSPDELAEIASLFCRDLSHGLRVMFTRDEGHWFPNEDWQNCWHLSISESGEHGPAEAPREARETLIRAFFSPTLIASVCHEHRPGSPIHHYRVFYNVQGAVIVPSGEMYTRRGSKGYFEKRAEAKAAQYGKADRA